jgi:hypothetical protein
MKENDARRQQQREQELKEKQRLEIERQRLIFISLFAIVEQHVCESFIENANVVIICNVYCCVRDKNVVRIVVYCVLFVVSRCEFGAIRIMRIHYAVFLAC